MKNNNPSASPYFHYKLINNIKVPIYNEQGFEKMRKAGKLAKETLDYLEPFIKEGISTEEINKLCHEFIVKNNAIPAPLNYEGFPKSCCTSINHVVCHGIPSEKEILKSGDIINVDITVILDGFHGDTSRTFCVGKVTPDVQKLVNAAKEALYESMYITKAGTHLGDIGNKIEEVAKKYNLSVVEEFCGHGIGYKFHHEPMVLNFGKKGKGLKLQEGMIFTIEPILNLGGKSVTILEDKWTAISVDKSYSAQWEHTVGITKDGLEVFTE